MKYHLQKNKDGRVFLSDVPPASDDRLLQTIEASSWIRAREQVNELEFDRVEGYGWFIPVTGTRHETSPRELRAA